MHLRPATNRDIPAVQTLVFGILRSYGLEPAPETTDSDLADIERHYRDRGGYFAVMESGEGKIIGTVAIYPLEEPGACELRKMYLDAGFRGQGLGRLLLEDALVWAKTAGFRHVMLETASVLQDAIRLYQSYGFQLMPPTDHMASRADQVYGLDL